MMTKQLLTAACAAASLMAGIGGASTALAAPPPDPVYFACDVGDLTTAALACSGYYDDNIINNNSGNLLAQVAGINALIGNYNTANDPDIAFSWNSATFSDTFKVEQDDNTSSDDNGPTFAQTLTGYAVIGIHYGGGSSPDYAGPPGHRNSSFTAFYLVDAGAGLSTINLDRTAWSNAYYYGSVTPPCIGAGCGNDDNSVPEPSTWALMIVGFGGAGAMLRRRRPVVA